MSRPIRLGILATHPIQYYSPLYRALSREVELQVFYAHQPTPEEQGHGFGVAFSWDVDLLEGYSSEFLANRSRDAAGNGFASYDTPEVGDRIRKGNFDAFLLMGWHARCYIQALFACRRAGVPVMVRGDSQLDASVPLPRRMAKRVLYPAFVRQFDACLSVGTRSDEYFRHFQAKRVVRAPHFVDNEFFRTRAAANVPNRAELRARLGIEPDARVALFAGKFVDKKRPLDFVRAIASAGASMTGLMVGDGELRATCEGEAGRLRAPVRFAGFLNQQAIVEAYAASDVLVLPSDARETWGLVVNEAMASGIPAVVSRAVGCAPDLVVPNATGLQFDLGDVSALGLLLRDLSSAGSRLEEMGAAAQSRVLEQFTVERARDGVLQAVDDVRIRA